MDDKELETLSKKLDLMEKRIHGLELQSLFTILQCGLVLFFLVQKL